MLKRIIATTLSLSILITGTVVFGLSDNAIVTGKMTPSDTIVDKALLLETFSLQGESTPLGGVKLSWEADETSTGYIVYRYNTSARTYEPIKTIINSNETSYVDTEASSGMTFYYQVTPLLGGVERKNSNIISVTSVTKAPDLSVSTDSDQVSLSWNAIEGATSYEIQRKKEADKDFRLYATTSELAYNDTQVEDGNIYVYKVRGINGTHQSKFSTPVSSEELNSKQLIWPIPSSHNITSYFGYRSVVTAGATSNHGAIDVSAPVGSSVVAAGSGTVTKSSYSSARGYFVVIDHENGMTTLYQHLSSSDVQVGQRVSTGDVIAYSGSTGVSTGAHLHFEVSIDGALVDPLLYVTQ